MQTTGKYYFQISLLRARLNTVFPIGAAVLSVVLRSTDIILDEINEKHRDTYSSHVATTLRYTLTALERLKGGINK